MTPNVAKAASNEAGAPVYSDPMLRAATAAVRSELAEWGIDSWGVSEIVAKAALEAALKKGP